MKEVFRKGERIDFPSSIEKYNNNPGNPRLLTQFMRSLWKNAGGRIGKEYPVENFPSTSKEIKVRGKNGQMAIYIPYGVTYKDLSKMFPKIQIQMYLEDTPIDTTNNSGWLWIERSINAPNMGISQRGLEEILKREKKEGQPLRTYIVGSIVSLLLEGEYFDQRFNTWSRLQGSCYKNSHINAFFYNDLLNVSPVRFPGATFGNLGGRSEEVVNAKFWKSLFSKFFNPSLLR